MNEVRYCARCRLFGYDKLICVACGHVTRKANRDDVNQLRSVLIRQEVKAKGGSLSNYGLSDNPQKVSIEDTDSRKEVDDAMHRAYRAWRAE